MVRLGHASVQVTGRYIGSGRASDKPSPIDFDLNLNDATVPSLCCGATMRTIAGDLRTGSHLALSAPIAPHLERQSRMVLPASFMSRVPRLEEE